MRTPWIDSGLTSALGSGSNGARIGSVAYGLARPLAHRFGSSRFVSLTGGPGFAPGHLPRGRCSVSRVRQSHGVRGVGEQGQVLSGSLQRLFAFNACQSAPKSSLTCPHPFGAHGNGSTLDRGLLCLRPLHPLPLGYLSPQAPSLASFARP